MDNQHETCEWLILHCMDFRFVDPINEFLKRPRGNRPPLPRNCDVVAVAGAAKNIARAPGVSVKQFVLGQIQTSKRLHNITKVIVMNHMTCGAYEGEDNERQHTGDLRLAKTEIERLNLGLEVHLFLAQINGETVTINPVTGTA